MVDEKRVALHAVGLGFESLVAHPHVPYQVVLEVSPVEFTRGGSLIFRE